MLKWAHSSHAFTDEWQLINVKPSKRDMSKDWLSSFLAHLTLVYINVLLVFHHCLLQLSVKGYNDKQHILLKKIIEKMATFEIDEKRFDIIKEAVSFDMVNANHRTKKS